MYKGGDETDIAFPNERSRGLCTGIRTCWRRFYRFNRERRLWVYFLQPPIKIDSNVGLTGTERKKEKDFRKLPKSAFASKQRKGRMALTESLYPIEGDSKVCQVQRGRQRARSAISRVELLDTTGIGGGGDGKGPSTQLSKRGLSAPKRSEKNLGGEKIYVAEDRPWRLKKGEREQEEGAHA